MQAHMRGTARGVVVAFALAVAGVSGGMSGPDAGEAVGAAMACRVEAGEGVSDPEGRLAGICAAVEEALRASAAPAELEVTLVAEALSQNVFRGHLRWRGQGKAGQGPSQEFGILDATPGPAFDAFIARALVSAAAIPQAK